VCEILAESEREALVAAAYLHDVGYAPELRKEGVHQLDGAHFARSIGVDDRVVNLIAHHSEARFEVALRGRAEALSEFVREESAVSDALTYCDLTTGPTGRLVNVGARLAEVRQRYEAGGVVMRALEEATPRLLAAVARTERRLRAAGLGSLVV
jgi:putative nucleotidyltransferase with HDIG domain